jgi:hypothetical protein
MRCLYLAGAILNGQSLNVYSEFARIGPSGQPVAPAHPREILSPAIVRNGFTSFQIAVQAPPGSHYFLYVGQNPEDSVKVTLYRESGDKLEKVDQPVEGSQSAVIWMDLWTERDAPVRRIKVEPELNVGSDWVTYPMEARVMDAVVPEAATTASSVQEVVCAKAPPAASGDRAALQVRNARQDVALSTRADRDVLKKLVPCGAPEPSADPEWYFRIRDYLFRMR